jgi:hypothetical protein
MLLQYRECAGIIRQYGFAVASLLALGTFQSVPVQAETTIIPSVKATQSYDTNIWFAPAEFLPPGTQLDDFATSVGGRVEVLSKERDIEASLAGGVDFNAYAHNSGLNYINTRVEGKANLDGWVRRLIKGAQFRVADTFRYTPESPSFYTGVKAGVVEDPFLRGLQAFRANTFANTASANGLFPIYRDLALDARYAFSILRVGSILAASATGASYFDTTTHSGSIGPQYKLTRIENLTLSYQPALISQTVTTGGPPIETRTQTVMGSYARVGQDWTFGVGAGITHVSLGNKAFAVGNMRLSTNPDRITVFRIDLSRTASPSFFFVSGALISNVGQMALSHKLSRRLSLQGNVNYGYSESVPGADVKYTNFSTGIGLNYKLTKIMTLDFFYNYSDFQFEGPGINYEVPRNLLGFSLAAEWK